MVSFSISYRRVRYHCIHIGKLMGECADVIGPNRRHPDRAGIGTARNRRQARCRIYQFLVVGPNDRGVDLLRSEPG